MAVTELALLLLSAPWSPTNTALRAKLMNAKMIMESYTNRTFYYFQQIEDPLQIYVVGEWDSVDQHVNHFIPSDANQQVLKSLEGELTVKWLEHIDAPHADLPLPKTDEEKQKSRNGELVYSLVRHFIAPGSKGAFETAFEANKHYLQDFVTEGKIGGGWRVDKEDGKEEFVLIAPWKSVAQHSEFAETEGFEKYGAIREFLEGAEIKHVKLLHC